MPEPALRRVNVVVRHQTPKFVTLRPAAMRPLAQAPAAPATQFAPAAVRRPVRPLPAVPAVVLKNKPQIQTLRAAFGNASRRVIAAGEANVNRIKGVGRGRLLAILGNGPSILEASLDRLKGVPHVDVMAINKPDRRLWPSKWWLFCDHSQYIRHPDFWADQSVTVINSTAVRVTRPNQVQIRSRPGKGFSHDLNEGFFISRSSCYAAMQVGLFMDYDQIFLWGVDMCAVNGVLWHYQPTLGPNPDVDVKSRESRFKFEAESYQWAADNLPREDRDRFSFCSSYNPHPFMSFFRRLEQKAAVDLFLKLAEEKRLAAEKAAAERAAAK